MVQSQFVKLLEQMGLIKTYSFTYDYPLKHGDERKQRPILLVPFYSILVNHPQLQQVVSEVIKTQAGVFKQIILEEISRSQKEIEGTIHDLEERLEIVTSAAKVGSIDPLKFDSTEFSPFLAEFTRRKYSDIISDDDDPRAFMYLSEDIDKMGSAAETVRDNINGIRKELTDINLMLKTLKGNPEQTIATYIKFQQEAFKWRIKTETELYKDERIGGVPTLSVEGWIVNIGKIDVKFPEVVYPAESGVGVSTLGRYDYYVAYWFAMRHPSF
ncbi:MAG: hypothetical protein ACFFG0_07030, partial [Candidatus Thorarchaeota archaeon]